ncbi:hypothetical protein [Trichloromonas sp.]|uniref:hypothetical protein n=1 Tax=Trichloromonas sp. TaxID=3069249 RepID=UPI002A41BC02|nr:hypothetical protein [Trichloromonas sp.]
MSTLEMLIRHLRFILFMVLLAWLVAVGSLHWLKTAGWVVLPTANDVASGSWNRRCGFPGGVASILQGEQHDGH